jgi:hypothetical protein
VKKMKKTGQEAGLQPRLDWLPPTFVINAAAWGRQPCRNVT